MKHAREQRGWSQEELARQVGQFAANMGHHDVVLDVSTISSWESGLDVPNPFYQHLLCSLFGMNADELGIASTGGDTQPIEEQQSTLLLGNFPPGVGNFPSRNTFSDTMFREQAEAPTEAYSAGIPGLARQAGEYKSRERYSSSPDTFSTFIERRRFLLTLLTAGVAGVIILGGGAIVAAGLLQKSGPQQVIRPPQPTKPPQSPHPAGSTRHWPTVGPDVHQQSEGVRVIQWMLLAHEIDAGGVDGVFGPHTENAVKTFQHNNGLPATGSVSNPTWEKLIVPSQMTSSQFTNQGSQVKALQEILNTYNAASPPLQVDGDFGALTAAATRRFQQTHGLPATGQADLNTWCLLVGGNFTH